MRSGAGPALLGDASPSGHFSVPLSDTTLRIRRPRADGEPSSEGYFHRPVRSPSRPVVECRVPIGVRDGGDDVRVRRAPGPGDRGQGHPAIWTTVLGVAVVPPVGPRPTPGGGPPDEYRGPLRSYGSHFSPCP